MKKKTKILLTSISATAGVAGIVLPIVGTQINNDSSSSTIIKKQQENKPQLYGSYLKENTTFRNDIWGGGGWGRLNYWNRSVIDVASSDFDYNYNHYWKGNNGYTGLDNNWYIDSLKNGIDINDITKDFLEKFLWIIKSLSSCKSNYLVDKLEYNLNTYSSQGQYHQLFNVDENSIKINPLTGEITFNVTLTRALVTYWADGGGDWYVTTASGPCDQLWTTLTITGAKIYTTDDPRNPNYNNYNTRVNDLVNLDFSNVLPQTARINNIDEIKNQIIQKSGIVQANSKPPLSANDFDLEIYDQSGSFTSTSNAISGFNNTTGSAIAKITFKPYKYYVGNTNTSSTVVKYIQLNGFMKLSQTTIKSPFNNNDYNGTITDTINNNKSKTFASSMTIEKVQQLVDTNFLTPSTFFNNPVQLTTSQSSTNTYIKPSYIKINKVQANDNDGKVYVDASLYGYENEREYLNSEDTKWNFKFTLNGYLSKNNSNDSKYFTTTIVPSITITDFNQTLAENAIEDASLKPDIKNIIVNYILNNYTSIFNYLNPNTSALTRNDISVWLDTSQPNFNNKYGIVYIDIQVLNGKAWDNGQALPSKIFTRIPVYGFFNQESTSNIKKTLNNPNVENQFTNSFTYNDALKFLNDHKHEIYKNLPIDAKIIIDRDSYDNLSDITNGIIHLKINCSSYYDIGDSHYVDNDPPNSWLDFTITGFNNSSKDPNSFTTTFNGGELSNVSDILPQFAIDNQNHSSDNQNVINAIKSFLLNGNIVGLPPNSIGKITAKDLNITLKSYNNFSGEITAEISLNNNKGWEAGINKQTITKEITFSGLKAIKGTSYIFNGTLPIKSPYDKKFASEFSYDDANKFINSSQNIKNQLFSNLPDDSIIWIKNNSLIADVANGTVSLEIAPSTFYDQHSGSYTINDANNCRWDKLVISGFNNNNSLLTTSVNGTIKLIGMDNVLAQDATLDKYWEGNIKAQVFNALSTGDYVHNLTNGSNVNILNSSNMDIFCRPNKDSTDESIIGSKIFWNNSTGTITVRLQIKDNLAWKDGISQQTMDFPLTITGFKKVNPTTQNKTTINVNQYNGIDWSKKLATDFSSNILNFINDNKNEIYKNLPENATLSIEGNPIIVNKNGTITINVNTNEYYSSMDGTKLVKSKMASPMTITLTGFNNVSNNGSIFTTQVNGTKLNNVDNILPDYLTNSLENISDQQKQQYLNQINQAIIDANCVINLAQDKILKPTDIELTNIIPNNKEGSITATVKIKNGVAQTNGNTNPNFEQAGVKFTGFKIMQPTLAKPSAGILLPNSTSILPYDANKQEIESFLNENKNQLFDNLPNNAKIVINSLTKDDPDLGKNGQVNASISVSPIYDDNGNLTNNALCSEVTISGFKPTGGINTVIVNKNITINELNNKTADDVVKSQDNDVKNIIINYLASNENIFSNLVTGADLTPNDITIGELTNPINIDGTLIVNDIKINNSKALVNGLPVESLNLGAITINGFKKQNPSNWLNTNENPFQFSEFKNIQITDINNEKLQEILQNHLDQILSNAPSDTKLSVSIDQGSIDIANGILKANVSASSYYDNQGNLKNDPYTQTYTFGFFIKNTNSTSIDKVNLPSPYDTQVASEAISSDTTNLANDIKQQIINNNLINNSYPLVGPVGDKFKVEIIPNSANNLNGTIQAKVTLDDGYYMENGVVITPSKPITINIDGFKKLTPTNVDNSTINNAINKKTNVNEIVNNPQTVSNIQNAVSNALTDNMFPNNKPATDQIKVTTSNLNPANGSFDVNIEIPGEYVDSEGNIQPGPFKTTITVNGCKSDTSTTSVVGGNLKNCDTIIATELNASTSSEIKNQIKQAMLDANLIKNTTSGKTFTTDNFDIEFIDKTANNLDGSISVNVTINSGYACENGTQINQPKVWSNIKLIGFQVLKPTTIDDEAINNIINKNLNPNQIASNVNEINKIKNEINNELTTNMFPNGNKPAADQIEVEISNVNPADGSFNIHVTIPGPTVNSDGTINNNGTQIDIPISGCKNDNNTTSAINGSIEGCNDIIASQIMPSDYNKIINAIINNGNIIIQTSSNKDKPISANDIEISVNTSTANNLEGSVEVIITIKNGYASKNGVIQNEPTTLAPVKITGFKTFTPTNINQNDIKNFDPSIMNANQFENDIDAMNNIANEISNNINPNMFPDENKPTADKITIQVINTNPAKGTADIKINIDVPQYIDKNGNIQNGPFQQTLTLKGFKKDTTTTSVLDYKKLNGLENLTPSDVNDQNINAINQIKQAIIDDYNNNKNTDIVSNTPILQNLNTGKYDITINDIDVNIVGNNNLDGSVQATITIKNGYACENGKPLDTKQFGPITILGLKQLQETVINEIPSPLGSQITANDLANSGSLSQIIQDGIINSTSPNMFPCGIETSDIIVQSPNPTDIDNIHGVIKAPVEINAPWVDLNGNIHNLDGNDPFRTTVTLDGLKDVPEQSWLDNNWWVILAVVAGGCLLILVGLIIFKKIKDRNRQLYGY